MTVSEQHSARSGLSFALAAYFIWGFLPLYFRQLHGVPPLELVAWRVVFTLPFCLIIITARRQWPELRRVLANWRTVARLCLAALLIGTNWLIYIWAIGAGHVLAASLGYYINPLLNSMLGTVFLGERLNRAQWVAVGVATVGIALLLWGALDMLGIAMSLAISFAAYGLVRKLTPVAAVPGLTIETMALFIPAVLAAGWYAQQPVGSSMLQGTGTAVLLIGCGVLTAVPLLMFAVATQRLDLSTLGFVQFLSPTIAFLLGLIVFHETLTPVRIGCFLLIWTAIALFSRDMLRRRVRAA